MTASIKVAMDRGLPTGTATYLGVRDNYCVFECSCGREFLKRKYKPYTSSIEDLMCPSCRNYSRVGQYQAERQIFRRVQHDARSRGLSFELTIEWFAMAIHVPCHYCGATDKNSALVSMNNIDGSAYKVPYRYNGIDRMDNSIGYIEENCLPCCFVCNRAKRDMDYFDFEEYLIGIARTWGDKV